MAGGSIRTGSYLVIIVPLLMASLSYFRLAKITSRKPSTRVTWRAKKIINHAVADPSLELALVLERYLRSFAVSML